MSKESITYSDFTAGDYGEVIALWNRCGLTLRVGDDLEGIQRTLAPHAGEFILAKVDDRIIGTVWATYDGRRGTINHLCVHPDFRRAGISSALLELAERRLWDKG